MLENTSRDTAPSKSPKEPSANSKAPWLWFTTAALGHPIREDECDRPLHSAIAAFVLDSTASYESLDHMDEMGHRYNNDTAQLMNLLHDMANHWKFPTIHVPEVEVPIPRKTNRKRFSVSHIARNP